MKKFISRLTRAGREVGGKSFPSTLGALVSRDHVLSLVDQGIVSATSFLTTFLIARWSGPTQLGIYALGLSVILSAIGFQENLILVPYQVQRYSPAGTPAEKAGASLILSLLFSAGAVSVLGLVAAGLRAWGVSSESIVMTLVIAAIVPFALTREFARRIAIARLELGQALLLDSAVAAIQLSTLGWLGVHDRMSVVGAWVALGAGCALPTAGWFYHARANFALHVASLPAAVAQTWRLGKWLLVARITTQLQGYAIYWLSVAIAGAAVTGIYAACMSVIGFANPMIFGLTNIFLPKSVLAWERGRGRDLWHQTIRNTALMTVVMIAFSVAIFVAGERVMRVLYHGSDFAGHGQLLLVLALATSVGPLGTTAAFSLTVMHRALAASLVAILDAILTIILVWILMLEFGLLGAAYAMLAANIIGALGCWIVFYGVLSKVSGNQLGKPLRIASNH
jgi:O-antigen/teichoic acid export membrane protein